jgi:hypothetical protein
MKCACGNLQCYVCSADVVDYSHFDKVNESGKICRLHGDLEQILSEEVAAAQENAIQALLETRPGLRDDDIRIDADLTTNIYNVRNSEISRPASPPVWLWDVGAPMQREAPQNPNQAFTHAHRRRLYRCRGCTKSFGSTTSLSQHENATGHNRQRMAQNGATRCNACHKQFGSSNSLFQHQRDKHHSAARALKRNGRGSVRRR